MIEKSNNSRFPGIRDAHIRNLDLIFSNKTHVVRNKCRPESQTFLIFRTVYECYEYKHTAEKFNKHFETKLGCLTARGRRGRPT